MDEFAAHVRGIAAGIDLDRNVCFRLDLVAINVEERDVDRAHLGNWSVKKDFDCIAIFFFVNNLYSHADTFRECTFWSGNGNSRTLNSLLQFDRRHLNFKFLNDLFHRQSRFRIDKRTRLRIDEVSRFGIDRKSGLRVDQRSFAFFRQRFRIEFFCTFDRLFDHGRLFFCCLSVGQFLQDLGNQRSLDRFGRGCDFFCGSFALVCRFDRLDDLCRAFCRLFAVFCRFDRLSDRRQVNFCTIFRHLLRLVGRIVRRLID